MQRCGEDEDMHLNQDFKIFYITIKDGLHGTSMKYESVFKLWKVTVSLIDNFRKHYNLLKHFYERLTEGIFLVTFHLCNHVYKFPFHFLHKINVTAFNYFLS